ncbi:MAG: hypothetical protein U1E36_05160 [Rickettsiales bacterium]
MNDTMSFRMQLHTLKNSYHAQNKREEENIIDIFLDDFSMDADIKGKSVEEVINTIDKRPPYRDLSAAKREFLGFCILEAASRSINLTPIISVEQMTTEELAAHKRELEDAQDITDYCLMARASLQRLMHKERTAPSGKETDTLQAVKQRIGRYKETEDVTLPHTLRRAQLAFPDPGTLSRLHDDEINAFKHRLGNPDFEISDDLKKFLKDAAAKIDPEALTDTTPDAIEHYIFQNMGLDILSGKTSERMNQILEATQQLMRAGIQEAFYAVKQDYASDDEHAEGYKAKRQAAFTEVLTTSELLERLLKRTSALSAGEMDSIYTKKLLGEQGKMDSHPDKGLRVDPDDEPERTLWRKLEAERQGNKSSPGRSGMA